MSWYKEGSVNIEQGSKAVIGIGTKWANPLIGVCAGQMLILKTANTIEIYEIASVQSDMQLTLANQYSGATKTGVSYEIPTAPKMSIEALALRISEMLNYYQQQMNGWQSILTGTGDITLTAPDGRVVTIKSQTSISNELIELVDDSKSFSESASQSATNADSSAQSALNSSNDATESAKSASQSASDASTSAQQSADSAQTASQSATKASESAQTAQSYASNAETSANNAAQSATEAKNAIESIGASIDTSNCIKKSGEENQSIDGSLNVDELTENGVRVYSPNNKPTSDDIGSLPAAKTVVDDVPIYMVGSHVVFKDAIGDQRLMPFRANELPFGWYFRNGDNYLLNSPQGQALNSLSDNYKTDHLITIKEIDGLQYINVPTAFHTDGRGFYERAVDGVKRQVGDIKGDEIRNITGVTTGGGLLGGTDTETTGALYRTKNTTNTAAGNGWYSVSAFGFDASRVVPTGTENKVLDIGMTPAIYLGV